MNKFRVLSIDFDFFQDTDKDTIANCYPDGVDLPSDLSNIIWASHYANYSNELHKVSINKDLLYDLYDILYNQSINIPVLITQSHVNIYNFINNLTDKNQVLSIVNVDLHHDVCNDNPTVDCGNWISHLCKEHPNSNVHWICRELSMECYNLSIKDFPIELNFDKIKDGYFDAIFICRSDMWLPPHLDNYFHDLLLECKLHFKNVLVQQSITSPRDITEIVEAENKIKQVIKRCKDVNNNSIAKQEA